MSRITRKSLAERTFWLPDVATIRRTPASLLSGADHPNTSLSDVTGMNSSTLNYR